MPNIDDLKNDGNSSEPFIPSISEPFIPSIEESEEVTEAPKKKPNTLSMTTGKKIQREKANISEMATPVVDNRPTDITEEILQKGGIFDQYVDRMTEEAKEFYAEQDMEEEINKDNLEDETTEKSEEELEMEEIENDYEDEESEDNLKIINNDILSDDDEFEVSENNIKIETEVAYADTHVDSDEEDDSSDDNDISDDDTDRYLEIIKNEISKRIKPVSKKMDITSFTIQSKPTMSNNIFESKEVPVAKWALPTTGITFKIKEILGSSIEKIRTSISAGNMDIVLRIIYDSIVSPKPDTMEAWAKSIAYDDFDHLFMGIYISAFNDSNYISMTCPNNKCTDKVFVTDNIPVKNMVKFKDKEAEKKFKELLESNATNPKGLITSEIVPISEHFAIGFKIPSLYDIYIEDRFVDQTFREKYDIAAAVTPYVDKFYYIDAANNQLVPIGYKEYVNNKAKTVKSKIVKYNKILSTLEMDEVNVIKAYMAKIIQDSQMITYEVPEATCPYCGTKIEAQAGTASQILFSRNQLSLLVNI